MFFLKITPRTTLMFRSKRDTLVIIGGILLVIIISTVLIFVLWPRQPVSRSGKPEDVATGLGEASSHNNGPQLQSESGNIPIKGAQSHAGKPEDVATGLGEASSHNIGPQLQSESGNIPIKESPSHEGKPDVDTSGTDKTASLGGSPPLKPENAPVQDAYMDDQRKEYLAKKEKMISEILNSLKSIPLDEDSVKSNLASLKALRDDFGSKEADSDIPDSKGCKFAQDITESRILNEIRSAWKDDIEKFFIDYLEASCDLDTAKSESEVQQCLKNAVDWVCKFNKLQGFWITHEEFQDLTIQHLTTLEKLKGFLIAHMVSKISPISYEHSYQQTKDALNIHRIIRLIAGRVNYISILPSFGIKETFDIYEFLRKFYSHRGDLCSLKYFGVIAAGGSYKANIVVKDLFYNFVCALKFLFEKSRYTAENRHKLSAEFDPVLENSLLSLNRLLKAFPDLLKEISDKSLYDISDSSPSLKAFLERCEENREFLRFLTSQFNSFEIFLRFFLKGMILESVLNKDKATDKLGVLPYPEYAEMRQKLNENERFLLILACFHNPSLQLLIFPKDDHPPVLKIKDLFNTFLVKLEDNSTGFDAELKKKLSEILGEEIPFIEDKTRKDLLKYVKENKFSEFKNFFTTAKSSLIDFIKNEYENYRLSSASELSKIWEKIEGLKEEVLETEPEPKEISKKLRRPIYSS